MYLIKFILGRTKEGDILCLLWRMCCRINGLCGLYEGTNWLAKLMCWAE